MGSIAILYTFSSGESTRFRSCLAFFRLASRPVSFAELTLVLLPEPDPLPRLGVSGALRGVLGEPEPSLPLLLTDVVLASPVFSLGEPFLGDGGALPEDEEAFDTVLFTPLSPRNVLKVDGVLSTFSRSVNELCRCKPGEFLGEPYGLGMVEFVLKVFERPTFLLSDEGLELR